MKVKLKFGKKKSRRAPLGAGLAIGLGGALLAWGYRRWARKAAAAPQTPASTPGHGQPQGSENPTPDEARLQEHFHSLDRESGKGHIPRDLERDPKNIEQTIHPG